ncbi:MAG: YciI family protein [Cyclobacteriaceae bacterium]
MRVADGKTHVLNGPYAETREQLGGYYMIDVPEPRRGLVLGGAVSWRRSRNHGSTPHLGDAGLPEISCNEENRSLWRHHASVSMRRRKPLRATARQAARLLAARTDDVAGAEDGSVRGFRRRAEGLARAAGVPQNPEAWLMTVARRKLIDGARRRRTELDAEAMSNSSPTNY